MTGEATADPSLAAQFKAAMRRLATTVGIVTTRNDAGHPLGMSVTAVTSLTTDPPALLVCVNRSASIHPHLALGTRFCVNLLAIGQDELCHAFGGRVDAADRFSVGRWEDHGGLPYLPDAQCSLFCTVDGIVPYGTHDVLIGRADDVLLQGSVNPLIFGNGRFLRHGEPA